MGKKRQLDVLTQSIESKLDGNGALRNVAVKDAWQRLRQNIDVQSWKEADGVLSELSDSLQKINMLKSMTVLFAKLRKAFQSPDELVDDGESLNAGEAPRVPTPREQPNEVQVHHSSRELEHVKKRLENSEKRNKELETLIDEKDQHIDKLTLTVHMLEKKHSQKKEEKIDNMKEQMKMKNLEKQVDLKAAELVKIKEENTSLTKRLNDILAGKTREIADLANPYPPERISQLFKELFKTLRNDAFSFYKSEMGMKESECAAKTLSILHDAYVYCIEARECQSKLLVQALVRPGENESDAKSDPKLEEIDMTQIVTLQKQMCKHSNEHVKNGFVHKLENENRERYSFEELTGCMPYIENCVELCWFMVLQTPPMHIEMDCCTADLDRDKFNLCEGCTRTKVDYLLWPALYREKDGKIVAKGIVQTK